VILDFQKLSSTVQEFLLKLPDEEVSARLRDNLLHALHFLQSYYRILQTRDKVNDPLQWTIDHSLSPLTPFREAPDKFDWEWINVDSQKVRQSLNLSKASSSSSIENYRTVPQIINVIKDGNIEQLKQIIKAEPDSVNDNDLFTRDCLTYAVQYDQYEILKILLKNGAKSNNQASDSSTSLHRAVYKNNCDMVQLLLENSANINAQDCYNRTPLHWSAINKTVDCLKVLLKYSPNLNVKDKDEMSPSMWACHLDHLDHLKLLTNLNDDDVKFNLNNLDSDNDGRTWIHWSVRKNEPLKCLKFLLNNNSIGLKDKEGKTCLHVAAEQGALQACKYIIQSAIAMGNAIIQTIINERDNKKLTPLHLATLNGHARIIKILIDNGSDVNLKDASGASPLDYVNKRNLFFCNSIIEVCMRKAEKRNNRLGAISSVSATSSFNGSEFNLTPAPPTTPKNTFTRSFQQLSLSKDINGRPPLPNMSVSQSFNNNNNNNNNNDTNPTLNSTAPPKMNGEINNSQQFIMPPSPPTSIKNHSLQRGLNWIANGERNGSFLLSRASSRTSLASDDLDKYMNKQNNTNNDNKYSNALGYSGSLNNLNSNNQVVRIGSSTSINNNNNNNNNNNGRILSGRGQQDTSMSADGPSNARIPPPVKVSTI
jgi:ankyrin repeat protein